jgi:hypothetical protein
MGGVRKVGKEYPKVLKTHIKAIAKANMRGISVALRKSRRDFDFMLKSFEMGVGTGDEDDQTLLEFFQNAKLNYEDPFHWWELLHLFVAVHTNRPPGAHTLWDDDFKNKVVQDCVRLGSEQSAGRISIPKLCAKLKAKENPYLQTEENLVRQISRFGLRDDIMKGISAAREKKYG